MAGINFNGGSFRPFNLNAVRGMGPIPECDKGKEPKDIKDFRDSLPEEPSGKELKDFRDSLPKDPSFYGIKPFNPNAVGGMGPIPECDKGKEPKDIKDFRDSHPKES